MALAEEDRMNIQSLSPVDMSWASVSQPPSSNQAEETREVVTALKALNKAELFGEDQELTFSRDPDTKRPVVQLVNRNTREVIRQIPPEYVLEAAKNLEPRQQSPPSGES
jgi:flagellar protein FlaG